MPPDSPIDEPLARALCRAHGFDPDERVPPDWLDPPNPEDPPRWRGFLSLAALLRNATDTEGLSIVHREPIEPPAGLLAGVGADAQDESDEPPADGWRVAFKDGRTSPAVSEAMARRMAQTSGGTLLPPLVATPRRGGLLGLLGVRHRSR